MPKTKISTRDAALAAKVGILEDLFASIGWTMPTDDDAASLEASIAIALQIASAETVEEVFAERSSLSGKEFVGRPFRITSEPSFRKSGKKGGIGRYLIWDARILDPQTGELRDDVISCGALGVMVQMAKLRQLGALFDRDYVFHELDATANGFNPLELRPAGDRVAAGEAMADETAPF